MSNLRPFQIVLLAVFGALAVGSAILLGAYQASINEQSRIYGDSVVIWGTFDEVAMESLFTTVRGDIDAFKVVTYEEFDEQTFVDELVNAIAEGRGPDMIILSSEELVTLRPKLIPITYETLPLRNYQDLYVDGAEIFTFPEGVYAIPFAVDPLMLYWNRDLFAANGLAQPPATWEDVVNLVVPNLTIVNNQRTILQSAVALGEYRNLVNPKAMLITLAMQSGSRLVYLNETQQRFVVELDRHVNDQEKTSPMQATMEFFTNFSNANSQLYTWNRVQPNDKNAFLAGELGVYFGLATEYEDIQDKNPNLNFDVSLMPQGEAATIKRTFADFYGFAIPQSAANPQGAYQVARTLTSPDYSARLAQEYDMVSPRRDVIAAGDPDPARQSALDATLIARTWFDPEPERTDVIFQEMVERVVSNRVRITEAVEEATQRVLREF